MKTTFRFVAVIGCAMALVGCATQELRVGIDAEVSDEGLGRASGGTLEEVWVRPGISLGQYHSVVLDTASVSYRDVSQIHAREPLRVRATRDEFPVPADQRERIERSFAHRLGEALNEYPQYRVVDAAGPGVLTLRASLVDFVSRTPPADLVPARAYVTTVAEATLVVEFWDTERQELLVRAVDHGKTGPYGSRLIDANAVTSWSEIDLQLVRWATKVRDLLVDLETLGST
jgi:hypothetical protein